MTRKIPRYENVAVTAYWLKHYCDKHCTLCGNSGKIDTSQTAVTAAGIRTGRVNFCICPNGQAMRAIGCVPAEFVEIKKPPAPSVKGGL